TTKDIENLGIDIFKYLGLGCRNVSKLFVPKDFDFVRFLFFCIIVYPAYFIYLYDMLNATCAQAGA
ncbi:MAG: hypothetical protein ACPG7F_18780, partial [Aggregatilineales bacterium]